MECDLRYSGIAATSLVVPGEHTTRWYGVQPVSAQAQPDASRACSQSHSTNGESAGSASASQSFLLTSRIDESSVTV
eukprot:scaffold54876_cov75-Phaeocystis_antarctica.AAC.1